MHSLSWSACAALVCMRRPGLHAPPWSACAALVCNAPPWSACAALVCMRAPPYRLVASYSAFVYASCKLFCHVVPAELGTSPEKTSRHMANTRSTIAVAARSGSIIPSYRLTQRLGEIRSTLAVAGRFKEVALQRILPPPIGFEVLVQGGLDVIFCLFRSFRPKFYRTFCRSRQDLTIYARPVTRISETHLRRALPKVESGPPLRPLRGDY